MSINAQAGRSEKISGVASNESNKNIWDRLADIAKKITVALGVAGIGTMAAHRVTQEPPTPNAVPSQDSPKEVWVHYNALKTEERNSYVDAWEKLNSSGPTAPSYAERYGAFTHIFNGLANKKLEGSNIDFDEAELVQHGINALKGLRNENPDFASKVVKALRNNPTQQISIALLPLLDAADDNASE